MRLLSCVFAFALLLASVPHVRADDAAPAAGKQVPQSVTVGDAEVRFLLFLPTEYKAPEKDAAGKRPPLLLFLHGSGERGDNIELVKKHGPPKNVESKPDLPFIVVSPQCESGKRWDAEQLLGLVDAVVKQYAADPNRLYVTGLSMGGIGTWMLPAAAPEKFAAAAPICGGGSPELAEKLKSVPVWVFHGAKDTAVSLSRSEEMVEALEKAGAEVKFTVYPEAGHDSWTETYNNPELYRWLLSQTLEGRKK